MENILVGVYICLAVQIAIVGMINLFQNTKRNKVLGVFCFLLIFSLLKRSFWESIEGSALYCVFGGPHELLYAPLLYTYLLVSQNNTKIFLRHISIAFAVYLILHFLAIIFFRDSHYTIAPYFLFSIISFSILYFLKGIRLFKHQLREKLDSYPRVRFQFFYISANVYILLKTFVIAIALFNRLVNHSILNAIYKNFSLPVFYYVVVPTFLILCLIYIFYALTEVNALKKSFIGVKIYKNERQDTFDYKKIESLLVNDKVYTNPNLGLLHFLNESNLKKEIVHQYLNDHDYENFQDLINSHRIEDFKERLVNAGFDKFDLFSIAKECGFKSKATFYRVFKKKENITPREYLQKIKHS
ncbi:AraC family transcriptional regulator [Aquimarina longa]|uniref:AraC family transcriptional regulator n=1 Tax=Aquimarina longa TaxID=1080221 RepID=UPI000782DA1D|nr:helix-turn-helix domain-containing protein [Aquimarina longa]